MREAGERWVLKHAVPSLGCCTACLLMLSPMKSVLKARAAGTLGQRNPVPWMLMVPYGMTYTVYGLIISDWYVFVASSITMTGGCFYLVNAVRFSTREAFARLEKIAYPFALALLAVLAATSQIADAAAQLAILGSVGSFIVVCLYASPLLTLRTVVRARDAASIHLPLALAAVLNSALWTSYGFAVGEPFIWAPSSVGTLFNFAQLYLKGLYDARCRRGARRLARRAAALCAGLTGQHGRVSPPVTQAGGPTDWGDCPICMEPMGAHAHGADRLCIELACSHVLCAACASKCSGSGIRSCPVCRHPHLLDPRELQSRKSAWRVEYGRWRKGRGSGAVGEITDITSPVGASKGGGPVYSAQLRALDLATMPAPPAAGASASDLCLGE